METEEKGEKRMMVSENLKKKYKEAVEACDIDIYRDLMDGAFDDGVAIGKVRELIRKNGELRWSDDDKLLKCPACGCVTVEEKEDNEFFCHGCRHRFGLVVVGAGVEFDELDDVVELPDNVKMHRDICNYLNELYARKNHDYGDSFHKTWLEEGAAAARLRIGDKFNRYKELSRGSDRLVGDETIEDTLIDMANYSIMALMEHRREAEENGCG
jgi:hypothetical protein